MAMKILGQLAPAATTDELLYIAPLGASTVCSSLVICNRGGAGASYRISVRQSDQPAEDKQYIAYDKTLAANETFSFVVGLTLTSGDAVYVYASSADLSFNLFGDET